MKLGIDKLNKTFRANMMRLSVSLFFIKENKLLHFKHEWALVEYRFTGAQPAARGLYNILPSSGGTLSSLNSAINLCLLRA